MDVFGRRTGVGRWMRWPGNCLALACLCLSLAALGQGNQVWTLDTTGEGTPRGYLDVAVLDSLAVGDTFLFAVNDSADPYPIRIDQIAQHNNGDKTWYGSITSTGLDYALVITAGDQTAHLILTSPYGIFQLFGIAEATDFYVGDFNQLQYVRDEVAITETVVPDAPGQDVITSNPLVVTQTVSQSAAPIGATLNFSVTVAYKGTASLLDQYLDIFFVLENTSLVSLPTGCEIIQSTEKTPVLSCFLGNLQPNQQKKVDFAVTTGQQSHPLVWSTAQVGQERSDVIVDVYRDVITDTDSDGTSDYNEMLLGTSATNPLVPASDVRAVIDVMVLYTGDIDALYLGEVDTRINQLFNVANKIFDDSKTGIFLRAVTTLETDYSPADELSTDLSRLTLQTDPAFADLPQLREFYGADLVVLLRTGEINGLCGLANLGGKGTQGDLSASYQRDFAYSVINIDCNDDSVLAHEIGHNLGLVHSRVEDPEGGTLAYSSGFGTRGKFVTVMAYPDDFEVINRLYRFSDPSRACGNLICGADRLDAVNGADSVSSLKLVKHQVVRYYPSQESRIKSMKTVSSLTGPSTAVVGLGAYTDDSANFSTSFSADDKVNLRFKITPLAHQIGKEFVTHVVVIHGKDDLLQGNRAGNLVSWSGSVNRLEVVTEHRLMNDMELFDLLRGIDFKALGFVNTTVKIFAGYRMSATRELVYGATPLVLTIGE